MKSTIASSHGTISAEVRSRMKKKKWENIRRNWVLYLFLVPAIAYIVIFNYVPMYGIQIAFKDYSMAKGFWGSEWVGLKWFEKFLPLPRFQTIIKNTLTVSV